MLRPARLLCLAAAIPALAAGSPETSPEAPPGAAPPAPRRNVLFLISDDLSAGTLGCYGNEQCKTPHIDALAAAGVRFTRAYCQFPVCGPSRAAIMSGMYPQQNGVVGNGSSARFGATMADRPSLAEHFRTHGYHSARSGKIYHMRVPGDITAGVAGPDHPESWDETFNAHAPEWMTEGEHAHLSNEKLNRDPDKHYNLGFGGAFYVVKGASDGAEQADHQIAAEAVEILGRHAESGTPFFLAVGFVRPHVPLVAPAGYFEPYPPGAIAPPDVPEGDWDDIPKAGISKSSRSSGITSEERKREVLAAYYASVAYMDAKVGEVVGALDRLGLAGDTVVVFTADHGYHLGEHDFWQKMSLHEESVRIPIIIRPPGDRGAGSQADTLAEQIDLYPTLCDLAGLPVPEHCRGVSLRPALEDPTAQLREAAYCLRRSDHLLRTDRHAYIRYAGGAEELYDMHADPQQFTNLAGRQPSRLEELRASLDAKLEALGGR